MISALSFHPDQNFDPASTDVMMNINSNGPSFTEENHHYFSLYQNQHEFVNQDIKSSIGLNATSSEQSSIVLNGHLYHYPPLYRQVKRRRRLTEEETNVLNSIFENIQKPDATTRAQLAQKLNMSSRAIQVWFQNRRAKVKRDALESKNAAKNNISKKLTLVADYCTENMSQHLSSLTLSPLLNTSTSLHNSTPKHFVSNCANLFRTSETAPSLAVALTTDLCTSLEERKFSNRNFVNPYVSQFIHLNKNENDNNELIQCEKSGCYWNTSNLKTVEIDDPSACDPGCGQKFEALPLLASPYFPEQSLNNFFQIAQDDSFRYNFSGPLGIVTPSPNSNMVNLLNMSNTLNTGYPMNIKQISTWLLDTSQKVTSNIFESNTQAQNDRHLP
ncbi:unnamed protein product [Rhizophagus irregularis]|uniref:Homeobox-domain-containing protein n=1 Tax=Rhizophagus irregularis TaxID=588596 RepID=A0A2N1N9X4_9GLOM|nr:homeobox-domain-containing protein [Rhizophagus irregularis]CAB4377790.1 unnamed protein product [Rhizophagus irregularis]CAB5394591.1 unnamed protein product [Rhizophagus irregularis]